MNDTDDIELALRSALPPELDQALPDLTEPAADAGLLDVAYATIDSPVGRLLIATTGRGLVRLAYLDAGDAEPVLEELARAVSPRVLAAPRKLDEPRRELDEYFSGARRQFDLPLDFQLSAGFRRAVLSQLPTIGYGHTASYAQVAAAAGSPRAVRAAGTACALNPLPVVVPCHRVVRSDGSVGRYRGGPAAKQLLLNLEAAA
jgi:methylated-DNA-[protein]-cysteine S-methyltransferase